MDETGPEELVLTLGGSGLIGTALAASAAQRGLGCLSLSLAESGAIGPGFRNIEVDLDNISADSLSTLLEKALAGKRLAGIVDIIGAPPPLTRVIAEVARRQSVRVGVLSTCLLYDHDGTTPIDESAPVFTLATARFPYIRKKLALEAAWHAQECDWILFRTHHVLGRGALLGCIPAHNRDRNLLSLLRARQTLKLVKGGDVWLSFIHAADLAELILNSFAGGIAPLNHVNAVHPDPILARQYYALIAEKLGCELPPISVFDLDSNDFWSSTSKNNVFCSRHPIVSGHSFQRDIDASIGDTLAISEARYEQLGAFMQRRIAGMT